MSFRSALVVFLRIAILIVLLETLLAWLASIFSLGLGGSLPPVGGIVGVFGILALVASPFLAIFVFADSVVRLLAPAWEKPAESDILTVERFQIIAFSVVGLYLMFWMCQESLGLFYYLASAATLDRESRAAIPFPAEQALRLAFGWPAAIYIFFGAPALRKVVSGMRGLGNMDR